MKEKGGKGSMATWGKNCILSFIPQPLSFGKALGRSLAYWVRCKNAMEISRHICEAQILDRFRNLAYCPAVVALNGQTPVALKEK